MAETWWVILALAAGTFAIRLGGIAIGQRLALDGAWARGLRTLPGCLIVALVAVPVFGGGPSEWGAGATAAAVALATNNLPATMAAGIAAIWAFRHFGW